MSALQDVFPEFSVSHVGLFVYDLDDMVDFYTRTFGLMITDRSIVRGSSRIVFMSRDAREHHQVVLVEGRTVPIGEQLLNQISLRVRDLDAVRVVKRIIEADSRVTDIHPSNHGNAFSLYFRDPEGNRLEVFADSPFYVQQAVLEPLDLAQSDTVLIEQTRARHGADPSFTSAALWQAEFAKRLSETQNGSKVVE